MRRLGQGSILLLLGIMFSGCAAFKPMLWNKNGGTQDEFAQVKYECLQASQQQQSGAYVNGYGGASQSGSVLNGQLFGACMNAHGWYLQQQT
jgi:hypothetical protein